MMQYLLDTNIISELSKPRPDDGLMLRFSARQNAAAIASVTLHEIRFGIERTMPSKKRELLERFYRDSVMLLPVLPYDDTAAVWHATERARLTAVGKPPAHADGEIAAVAHVHDLILVTANLSDFKPFNDLPLENWIGT